ncbi:hypothetical protein K8089_08415 [Aequorivita sp. F47161]|uniref:Uncharacterized protein n=1 Tax=Aequorivita vitellina TaxID=2874475 RepID=A0A9X1U0I7_9FLAO|nr:hypothetical protein [Aequorivita vitellina]MCG2419044.1 hypothetical protein [Aequorivita vitellina]
MQKQNFIMIWMLKNKSCSTFIIVFLIINLNILYSQNIKCDNIEWNDYQIKTDSLYAYFGSVKLAEINGNIFNKTNSEILKAIFDIKEDEKTTFYLTKYFLSPTNEHLNIKNGFTEFITQVYCINEFLSYQIESYTIGAKTMNYKYLNYNLNTLKEFNFNNMLVQNRKEDFNQFLKTYLYCNKETIIKNFKNILEKNFDNTTQMYFEIFEDPTYRVDNIIINTENSKLKYFNSKGVTLEIDFVDLNFSKITNEFGIDGHLISEILIPYSEIKIYIKKDFLNLKNKK